ncbi:MAG: GNAT family N-acetyltransferase [Siphonobacter sp.]
MITLRKSDFSAEDVQKIRQILLEYADSLNISLDFQHFDQELADLQSLYGWPTGCIILAEDEKKQVLGCVALKPLKETGVCEMKRLYVRPGGQKKGTGRKLAEAIIDFSRKAGYHTMKLDSLKSLSSALKLYEKLGFVPTAPYVHNPHPDAVYMELIL